uniref:Uncharacterized protein n=1 Tax=Siphoviridae sp. ctJYR23 TaxID=2827837 RepID=A0A8S5SL79_9CAUD|nr:MAG TPA: hypothetical protein [Siphoviridae sp. ctJYR23]
MLLLVLILRCKDTVTILITQVFCLFFLFYFVLNTTFFCKYINISKL